MTAVNSVSLNSTTSSALRRKRNAEQIVFSFFAAAAKNFSADKIGWSVASGYALMKFPLEAADLGLRRRSGPGPSRGVR